MSDPGAGPEAWAGTDFQQPPRTDGGVALCGSCRRTGACRLGLTTERLGEDGRAVFDVMCPVEYEGGPRVAHGGWTASVLDEVLGHVPILLGHLTVTGTLTVRFIRPVPIERPLVATGWVEDRDGLKWSLSGELALESSGAVLATATGVWIERQHDTHFGGFERWLADQGSP